MIKYNNNSIVAIYKEGINIVAAYYGKDLVFSSHTEPFPDLDENSTFDWRDFTNGDYVSVKDGEVVESNMNLLISDELNTIEGFTQLLNSETSKYKVYKYSSTTSKNIKNVISEGSYLAIINCSNITLGASVSSTLVFDKLKTLNCRLYSGNYFYYPSKFAGNKTLEKVIFPNKTTVTACDQMFQNCTALKEVHNLPQEFEHQTFQYLFDGCSNLEYVPAINWGTPDDQGWHQGDYLFRNCKKLKTVPIKDYMYCGNSNYVFQGAGTNGLALDHPINLLGGNMQYMFNNSGLAGNVELFISINAGTYIAFNNCQLLTGLKLNLTRVGTDLYVSSVPNLTKLEINNIPGEVGIGGKGYIQNNTNLKYISINNLNTALSVTNTPWGQDSEENRKSLVDSLLTNSVKQASTKSITLPAATISLLTDEEKAAITAKGFTLVQG